MLRLVEPSLRYSQRFEATGTGRREEQQKVVSACLVIQQQGSQRIAIERVEKLPHHQWMLETVLLVAPLLQQGKLEAEAVVKLRLQLCQCRRLRQQHQLQHQHQHQHLHRQLHQQASQLRRSQ